MIFMNQPVRKSIERPLFGPQLGSVRKSQFVAKLYAVQRSKFISQRAPFCNAK